MCIIGFIVGDIHPCLKTISEKEIDLYVGDKPILIVGFEKAAELYPNVSMANKAIDEKKKLYYSFSKDESEVKYQENLDNFIKNCFELIIKKYKVVNAVKLEDIQTRFKEVYLHETQTAITITDRNTIYYINKEITSFFNKEPITIKSVINYLTGCDIISWDYYKFYGAYLKADNNFKSKEQVKILFNQYGDIDLYMGAVCLSMLKGLKLDVELVNVWQRAFSVETMLSDIKVKVNEERIRTLASDDENIILQNIYKAVEDGYIVQKYNGTNKITGRIYPFGTGFSLQSLSKPFRDIIIAEPNCVLIEFDYKAFEYTILSQLCEFNIKGDPHLYMSQLLFKDNEHRKIGKDLNYSLLYGKSVDNIIAETLLLPDLKISKEELKEKLLEILAPVDKLQKALEKELKETGCLRNYFGRNIYPEKTYACLNNYVQSTAAEILIIKLAKLFLLLDDYDSINKVVLQSHDSILLNLSLDTIDQTNIASDIKDLLESPENGLVNFVDLKYGEDWKAIS